MDQKFGANLQKAQQEQQVRNEALGVQFRNAVKKDSEILGCGRKCYANEVAAGSGPFEILSKCCNDGVVRVTVGTVNTAAAVENVYGNAENLSEEDVHSINKSLQAF